MTDDAGRRTYAVLAAAAVLAVVPVLAFALASRPMGNDEGIWLYVGRLWSEGTPPYVGAVENKTPGVLAVSAAAVRWFGTTPWPGRIAGALHVLAAAVFAGRIVRKLVGPGAEAPAIAVVALAAAAPALDGAYATATESFTMAWQTLALLLLLHGEDGSPRRAAVCAFLAGAAVGVATGFKQIAVVGGGTVAAWIWIRGAAEPAGSRARRIGLAAAGGVAGLALVSLPALVSVPLADYLDGAFGILLDAGTRPEGDGLRTRLTNLLVAWDHPMPLLVAGAAACWFLRRSLPATTGACLAAWVVFDGLGVHAAGRYYGHQFREWIPPLAACSAAAIAVAAESAAAATTALRRGAGALAVAVLAFAPWRLPADASSRVNRRAGEKDREIAAWIAAHTSPGDRVLLVHPDANPVLAQSGRRALTRWFNTIFLGRRGARQEVEDAFRAAPPALVAFPPSAPADVRAWVEPLLGDAYEPPQDVLGWSVRLRRAP